MKTTAFLPTLLLAVAAAAALAPTAARAQAPSPFGTPYSPAPAPAQSPNASNNVQAGTAGNYSSSTTEGMTDRLFNVNSDSIDFENGSFQWKGRTFNLGNSRLMRARLESFLARPAPTGEGKRYEQLLKEIETLLSPSKLTKANYAQNLQRAWQLLDEAAEFEADADNCRTISTLVEKTARMRGELRTIQLERNLRKYEHDRARRRLTEHETSREARVDSLSSSSTSSSKKGGTVTRSNAAPKFGTEEAKSRTETLMEKRGDIVRSDREMTTIGLKSRVEFQSQIVAFLLQRRFHHAIIASAFYRQIYQGASQELRVGEKQVKEMFPISDFVPSIDSIDSLAREAIKDVDNGMKSINSLYDSGERFGAFERMQETFFLGEYEPAVQYFDPAKKKVLQEIWRTARDLQRMGDDRDLTGVETAVQKVKIVADDFPSTQIMSKVNNAKQASDLELLAAETALFQKDLETSKRHLTNAGKIWPTNPGIRDFAANARKHANKLAQLVPEFDRLVTEGNSRSIYNRGQEFALALMSDEDRAPKLKAIMENLSKIDAYLLNARTLHRRGGQTDIYSAWDIVQEAGKFDPKDPEVGRARSELAPAAARYTALLQEAEKNELDGHYAAGLTFLLAAQELNQGSEICRQGILRLSSRLMEKL